MGTTGAVLEAEAFHLVAELRERRSCGRASKAAAHDEHGELALVLRIDELGVLLVLGPLRGHRAGGNVGIKRHGVSRRELAAVVEEQDRDGDGAVAHEDQTREGVTEFLEQRLRFVCCDAKRLEQAAEAVAEMAGEQQHGDDVEDRSWRPGEARDDHAIDVMHRVAVERGLVGAVVVAGVDGEVQKVVNDEGQDGQTAPDHGAGGFAAHLRLVLAILGQARRAVGPGQ